MRKYIFLFLSIALGACALSRADYSPPDVVTVEQSYSVSDFVVPTVYVATEPVQESVYLSYVSLNVDAVMPVTFDKLCEEKLDPGRCLKSHFIHISKGNSTSIKNTAIRCNFKSFDTFVPRL